MKKLIMIVGLFILAGVLLAGCTETSTNTAPNTETKLNTEQTIKTSSDCNIKGNISQNTGEKIYHVPGQQYYNATQIDASAGEKWFCTEGEARSAGWRKSKL